MRRCLLIILLLIQILILFHYAVEATVRTYETPRFLTKKSCSFEGGGCNCTVRLRSECCCKGREVHTLPTNLTKTVRVLVMFNTSVTQITPSFFAPYPNLEEIEVYNLPELTYFDNTALTHLSNLRKLSLTWCHKLTEVSGKFLEFNLKMQYLVLKDNGLTAMPAVKMTEAHKLDVDIDFSGNKIQYIGDHRFRDVRARRVKLNNNRIREIAGYAFKGSSFQTLALNHNEELTDISVDAFKDIVELHHLDLSDTSISLLPITGLKNLRTLTLQNVPSLKRIPSVLSFTRLETAHFTYPHHCCLFKYVDDVVEMESGLFKNNTREIHSRICKDIERKQSRRRRKRQDLPNKPPTQAEQSSWQIWLNGFLEEGDEGEPEDDEPPPYEPDQIGGSTCLETTSEKRALDDYYKSITCTPQPDSLNPCENIVGYALLRRAIWLVWILAIAGNVLVWITLGIAYDGRMKNHYLFMVNLSIADLLTGVYLAILAIADVRTSDEYYRHAVGWQTGWGCKTAGFVAVFASKLSIISLFLIAFEMVYSTRQKFYGIEISFRKCCVWLAAGWIFSLVMASLPFFGVSSYSTTSICLPLRVNGAIDRTYLMSGLLFNLFAFVGMVVSYGILINMLRDPSTPSRPEDKVFITKFSLMVITDFVCWFPTIFFGLTASIGMPLISLSNAKIFLVFFFPINAFANPFLYVFFTEVIQRNVKKKAIPVLKRITSSPGVALNTLSNFYHSAPPGGRRDDVGSPSRLAVTQLTSLNSTPRGSNCSSHRTVDSMDGLQDTIPRRSTPRVSFQEEVISRSSSEYSRRSFGLLKRISAIPEVSDLSEHSSESHHEHVPTQSRKPGFNLSRVFGRYRNDSHRGPILEVFAGNNYRQIPGGGGGGGGGADSGRGSMTSDGARELGERHSLTGGTSDAESTTDMVLLAPPPFSHGSTNNKSPKIIAPEYSVHEGTLDTVEEVSGASLTPPTSGAANPLAPPPRTPPPVRKLTPSFLSQPFKKVVDRRRSAPLVRPLLVVSEYQDEQYSFEH